MASVRFQNSAELPAQRARAFQSVFPGLPGPIANSPQAPGPAAPPTRAQAMAAPTPNHLTAAARAAQAVAARLASNPPPPPTPYVAPTRANTPLTQSAGTINTNYVNSARAQGYNNVNPPDILARGSRNNSFQPATGPLHDREYFRNQVFVPTAQQVRQNMFSPPPLMTPPVPPVQQPSPQVPVPQPTFPPRNNFLNILFPTQ